MVYRRVFLGAAILTAIAGTAEAGPRDDMLAGISRCTSFSDERTFLDCVYGAAQPVRAELGLPPAPQSQTRLVPNASLGAPAAPLMARTAPPPDQRDYMDRLLGSGKPITPPVPVQSYSFDTGGFFTVTLSNGQVWRQVEGDFNQAHWNKPASSYTASVETGASGSSNLRLTGETGFYKVKRVR
jgi:hypothetical protein